MEEYKLESYFEEFQKPLEIWTLDDNLSATIIKSLNKTLQIPKEGTFFTKIYNSLNKKIAVDLINTNKGFEIILQSLNLEFATNDQMYLIWDSELSVDICSVATLCKYWDSIWYGTSDESLILFIPNKIVLFISDWGEVGIEKISE